MNSLQMVGSMPFESASNYSPIESYSIMGKVIRIRPNIYIFVCEYCASEHRSIDNFLRHAESHFQQNGMATGAPSTVTHIHSNQIAADDQLYAGTSQANTPYPVKLLPSADITADPVTRTDEYIDEVYEIIDLGYDVDGKHYPNAKKVPAKAAKKERNKPQNGLPKNGLLLSCSYCSRNFKNQLALKRHTNDGHGKILKKIMNQKKAYKCKVCGEKFPIVNYTLEEAQKHLKVHFAKR